VEPARTRPVDDDVPVIRRGDRVVVEVAGDGFTVGLEAVAEADSRGNRVTLRPVNGGRRLVGQVAPDGRVHIRGLNSMVNGR
jgi:flagella basal body P-ring formation protein FlgA